MITTDKNSLSDFISQAIKERLEREAKSLVEEAKKELEKRAPEIVAGIVVDIMGLAEFQTLTDRYVFTIKKP